MSHPVMIFAAGFGTRMGALTQDQPKPMIPVAGRPLIDHMLDLVLALDPPRVVANTHYLPEPLERHLRPKGVEVSRETPDILDTGGGLKAALPLLGSDTTFTANSDMIWSGPNPLSLLADAWDPERMDALLIGVPVARAIGRKGDGDFTIADDGRLTRGGPIVYGGVQILKTDRVAACPDAVFSLNRIWDDAGRDGRLYGLTYPGHWCDVGHPEGITLAEDLLASGHV